MERNHIKYYNQLHIIISQSMFKSYSFVFDLFNAFLLNRIIQ